MSNLDKPKPYGYGSGDGSGDGDGDGYGYGDGDGYGYGDGYGDGKGDGYGQRLFKKTSFQGVLVSDFPVGTCVQSGAVLAGHFFERIRKCQSR